MLSQINGLHHVTSLATDAAQNNAFFTKTLGLRRVKQTVNHDDTEAYHLYYGNEIGTPGTAMTYFIYPGMASGRRGVGEVALTQFAIPKDSAGFWCERFAAHGVEGLAENGLFGERALFFSGPDGEALALVETEADDRSPWDGSDVPESAGVLGFHGVRCVLQDSGAIAELLRFIGYSEAGAQGDVTRYVRDGGNAANVIDLQTSTSALPAAQGAGSVHHIAFSVADRDAQLAVRKALLDTGYQVTPVIDRNYFWSIYFRTPEGVLLEVATDEPGFAKDEDRKSLGASLILPKDAAAQRDEILSKLPPLED